MLGQQALPQQLCPYVVCGVAPSATWPNSSPEGDKMHLTNPSCYVPEIILVSTTHWVLSVHRWYRCFLTMVERKLYIYIWLYVFK